MSTPAIIYLILAAIGLGITIARHGQPRPDKYNVFSGLISSGLTIALLYWGNFFS